MVHLLVDAFSDVMLLFAQIVQHMHKAFRSPVERFKMQSNFETSKSNIDRSILTFKNQAEASALSDRFQQQLNLTARPGALTDLGTSKSPEAESSVKAWQEALYGSTPLVIESYQIRILSIEPGSGVDPIRCELSLTDPIPPAQYTALSYCVGNHLCLLSAIAAR